MVRGDITGPANGARSGKVWSHCCRVLCFNVSNHISLISTTPLTQHDHAGPAFSSNERRF